MPMLNAPPLLVMDYVGPVVSAAIFVVIMSLVKEPTRRTLNAVFVAGASGVYLSGGFGPWELLYPAIAAPVAYLGLRSYRFIGVAWLMHSCWDILLCKDKTHMCSMTVRDVLAVHENGLTKVGDASCNQPLSQVSKGARGTIEQG